MNTNLHTIVKQLIATHGEGIFGDPQRLKPFFSDLAKDEPKPLRVAFGRCIEKGAYAALKTASDAADRGARKAAIARQVCDNYGLDITLCTEALDILEAALYKTAPPSYRQPAPSAYTLPSYTLPAGSSAPVFTPTPSPITPAAGKKTVRNVLIAAAVAAAIIAVVLIVQRTPPVDTELKDTAILFAASLNSDAFEGFDPGKEIIHYYFIPATSEETSVLAFLMALAGEYNYMYARTMDSGVVKAKNAGYNAAYGAIVYRENNRRDGEIKVSPAQVTTK